MRTRNLIRPLGTTTQTDFHQGQQSRAHDELQFFDTATVKWEQTTRGIRANVKIPPATPAAPANGFNYRGLWSAGAIATPATVSAYMTLDVVQYGSGTSSGMYFSTIDTNINLPDSGIGWVQISSSSGTWI